MRSFRFPAVALAAAGVLSFSSLSDATIALYLGREDLVAQSDLVVRANVMDAQSAETPDGRAIVTRTRLRVGAYAKGAGPGEIVLEQWGGTLGDRTMIVHGDARLTAGEDVVLFLRRPADAKTGAPAKSGGVVHLTALAQSAYHVRPDGLATRDLGDLGLVARAGAVLVPVAPPVEPPEPVAKILADVARIAAVRAPVRRTP